MKAVALFWSFLLGCVALMAWAGGGARQQGITGSLFVRLQPGLPTAQQTGNANVSGNITAGQFQGDGSLLTNLNAGGVGTGILTPAHGGTGLNTSATTAGRLLYTSAVGTWNTLAPGTNSQVLTLVGGVPAWSNPVGGGLTLPYTGTASVASPNAVFKLSNTGSTGVTIWSENAATSGTGIFSNVSATTGVNYAGLFQAASPSGIAVYGINTATTGVAYGGRFTTASPAGAAVIGSATATSGTNDGGIFESAGTTGVGAYGHATSPTGTSYTFGLYGQSDSASNPGGVGVYGFATANVNLNYGVYGQTNSAAGYGVWSQGRTGASGTKSFRIDYPNDPENKYLNHYSAESPEVLNMYRGTVTLDRSGNAVVQLPSYFAMINKSPSYQLTAVGAAMPNLHVAEKVNEQALARGAAIEPGQVPPTCNFTIAGGAPGKEVSWMVNAVRNDRWVQRNGAPVQVDKQGIERGTYQHPELYGQPPERGMTYEATHRAAGG